MQLPANDHVIETSLLYNNIKLFAGTPELGGQEGQLLVQLFYEFASENARNAAIELQE